MTFFKINYIEEFINRSAHASLVCEPLAIRCIASVYSIFSRFGVGIFPTSKPTSATFVLECCSSFRRASLPLCLPFRMLARPAFLLVLEQTSLLKLFRLSHFRVASPCALDTSTEPRSHLHPLFWSGSRCS